ncbi:hypothetical protein [Methanobrevibacter sp.]
MGVYYSFVQFKNIKMNIFLFLFYSLKIQQSFLNLLFKFKILYGFSFDNIFDNGGKNMVNAIISAILSFIIPGLGQAINGDVKKGVVLLVIALIMGLIASFIFRSWIVYIINICISLYAAYDAYITAN